MFKNCRKLCLKLSSAALLLALTGCASNYWVFPFERVMVEYDLSGDLKGRERFFAKGDMEAREAVIVHDLDGIPVPTQTRIVTRDGKRFFFSGVKTEQGDADFPAFEKMKGMDYEDRKDFYLKEVLLEGAVFNKIGKDNVLGRECEVFKVEIGTLCVWNNLVLKKEFELEDSKIVMMARDIKLNTVFDDAVFEVE